jgi:nitroreductase
MEFKDAVFSRRMTRHFTRDSLDDQLLDELLRAALRSPTAGNAQGVDLLVLTDPDSLRQFWELISLPEWRHAPARSSDLMAAPVIVIPLGDPSAYEARYRANEKAGSSLFHLEAAQWPVPYWTVDASFVAMTLLLGAQDAGLGALFFQLQGHERELLSGFGIPGHFVPIGAIALGHPMDRDRPRPSTSLPRRGQVEVVHREHW